MGITTTTNLSLIKPDTNEYIKENLPTFLGWAKHNSDNCDRIDSLFRASTTTYSPTWSAVTTPPTLGSGGSVTGKILRLWPRMVIAYFQIFTGGAGFSAGSGTYSLSLPTGFASEFPSFTTHVPLGTAIFLDNDTVLSSSVFQAAYVQAANTLQFFIPQGGAWSNTNPVTLAQNDRLSGYIMYPTSDA